LSIVLGAIFYFIGKNSSKKIIFQEQLVLIILIYLLSSFLISIPIYFSIYQITFINSIFESISGLTGTGFSVFKNIKYLDPTLIIWRSSSQWLGGLYFLIFLVLFFSNTQFQYKLNNLVFSSDKSLNPENNIKKISIKIFFLYTLLTLLIFVLLATSNIRLFNSLNLSMSLISTGGFLPANSASLVIKTNLQKIILIFSFILSSLNIFFIYNIFNKNFFRNHYEDYFILIVILVFSFVLYVPINNANYLDVLINVSSSIANSGIITSDIPNNFSMLLLFLTIIGGSIISNSSGIKLLRFYILFKASFIEIIKIVRPHNVFNQKILSSDNKITNENIKLSFYIFISFFICLFILSGLLLFNNFDFENAFKLSILTLTNTTISNSYGLNTIDFANLLTSSKLFLIMFMIIGKIELISLLLIIKKILFKD
tara:strand:+ start:3438 stop:4718 length:1281 start_codon:yes stop_codon:yes gene_type:complete